MVIRGCAQVTKKGAITMLEEQHRTNVPETSLAMKKNKQLPRPDILARTGADNLPPKENFDLRKNHILE
jgi:hypothetical protein